MAAIKKSHEEEVAALTQDRESVLASVKAEYADQLNATISDYEAKLAQLTTERDTANYNYQTALTDCERRLEEMQFAMTDYNNEKARLTAELDARLQQMQQQCDERVRIEQTQTETVKNDYEKQIAKIKEDAAFVRGELDGMRIQQGKMAPSAEYTSRERFTELEEEYMAFQKFFKKQWEYTKKEIRKTLLWTKEEKKKLNNGG
ncbi:MAG: hypothetical protein K2N14_02185 [Clostridia bacterium]|nr:hypothetical protein [Clostridia bacterium]